MGRQDERKHRFPEPSAYSEPWFEVRVPVFPSRDWNPRVWPAVGNFLKKNKSCWVSDRSCSFDSVFINAGPIQSVAGPFRLCQSIAGSQSGVQTAWLSRPFAGKVGQRIWISHGSVRLQSWLVTSRILYAGARALHSSHSPLGKMFGNWCSKVFAGKAAGFCIDGDRFLEGSWKNAPSFALFCLPCLSASFAFLFFCFFCFLKCSAQMDVSADVGCLDRWTALLESGCEQSPVEKLDFYRPAQLLLQILPTK